MWRLAAAMFWECISYAVGISRGMSLESKIVSEFFAALRIARSASLLRMWSISSLTRPSTLPGAVWWLPFQAAPWRLFEFLDCAGLQEICFQGCFRALWWSVALVGLVCVPLLACPERHTRLRCLLSRCTSVHLMFDSTFCSLSLLSLFVGSCLTAFRFCILVECMKGLLATRVRGCMACLLCCAFYLALCVLDLPTSMSV